MTTEERKLLTDILVDANAQIPKLRGIYNSFY